VSEPHVLLPVVLCALALAACGDDDAASSPEVAETEPADAGPPPATPDAEAPVAPRDPPPIAVEPTPGEACGNPGESACLEGHVVFCRDGVGGARWMDRGACPEGQHCASGFGCAPLPRCGGEGLVACVGQDAFVCDDDGWTWDQTCPLHIPCVHGVGCPNEHEVGLACLPGRPPRCIDGQIQRCVEDGTANVWSEVVDCPAGSACVEEIGCVRPDGCSDPEAATCLDAATAVYCDELGDGALGWSAPVQCRDGCVEGRGCALRCRDTRWIGGCR
jgi:hypothetical protein